MKLEKSLEERKSTFEKIKAKVLSHLEKLEEEEKKTVNKAFTFALLGKGGRGLPVGTIREWKGKKFIKIAPGKWRPKYDSHTKGAKLAISALKKKIVACKDEHEMMQIILENRDRFTDSRGNPLPFVQELYQFIREEQNSERRISPEQAQKNRSEAMKGNQNAKKEALDSENPKATIIPEVPQEKLKSFLDKIVNEGMKEHASYFENIHKNWLDWGHEKFPDEYIKKYNLSRDVIPSKREIEIVFEEHFREKAIDYAVRVANTIRSKDIYDIYYACVYTLGWQGSTLFKLITGKGIKGKSKKEALDIIKEYAGKDKIKEYEQKMLDIKKKEKQELEQKQQEKKEKEKKEIIETIKDNLRAERGEKENQQIAEDFYEWANSQPNLARGKIIKYFTSDKRVRYNINGEKRIESRVDFIYDIVVDSGYNIIDKENKRLEDNKGWGYDLAQTDFLYGEHLVNNMNKESRLEEKKKKALEYGFDLSNYYPLFSDELQEAGLDNDLYLCDRISEVVKKYNLSKKEIRAFVFDIHFNKPYYIEPEEEKWVFDNIIVPRWGEAEGSDLEQAVVRLGVELAKKIYKEMIIEYKNIIAEKDKELKPLSNILGTGKTSTVKHKELGEIIIDEGTTGNSGYGLKHIIEQGYKKDGKDEDEITALLYLIQDMLKDGKVKKNDSNYAELTKDGLTAVLSKQRHGNKESWLLKGYELHDENGNIKDSIKEVLAHYDYTFEYSALNSDVKEVIASLDRDTSDSNGKGKMKKSIIKPYKPSQPWKKAMAKLKAVYNL